MIATALPAHSGCRQALALGLDVSGSVDAQEYQLQLQGLAGALQHDEVQSVLLAMPSHPVRLAVFEWSGPDDQRVLLPWTEVVDPASLTAITRSLSTTQRTQMDPSTALGSAKQFGAALLDHHPECWKRTLDLSGDGFSNTGPLPRDVKMPGGQTVNALVIGSDDAPQGDTRQTDIAALSSYFHAWVIEGPDAFVETALGFADFERAMVRKLKRELQGLSLATGPAAPITRNH
nr:DUF1194 domain-containing protein [Shimia abyssi]